MMLSSISQSSIPFQQSREQLPTHTMTTSLAILPQRQPALRQPQSVESLPRRPKLQLNTQQIRTFGKGSSLRLETLSAVSPTARNTFSNAYEAPTPPAFASGRPAKPRLSIDSSITEQAEAPNSASTSSSGSTSASSVSSTESATIRIPYKQPHNLVSILSNGAAAALRPRKMTSARPLFPATKRVSFRTPLEEEITTTKYTMAHSDIESTATSEETRKSEPSIVTSTETNNTSDESEGSTLTISTSSDLSSTGSRSPSVSSPSEQSSSPTFSSEGSPPRLRGPRAGQKRDSSSSDSDSEDSCPETPVAGRRKRMREWVWTLGPINGSSTTTTSDDDSN